MTEPIAREFERYKTTLRMEQARNRHTQAELEATLAELRAARKVVEAALEFSLAVEIWLTMPEVPQDDPEAFANASGAFDATGERLKIALADYEASQK